MASNSPESLLDTSSFPHVPQGVFGVCEGCGAVAWELLNEISPLCLGCAPWDYSRDDDQDDCGSCGCVGPCEYDGEQ